MGDEERNDEGHDEQAVSEQGLVGDFVLFLQEGDKSVDVFNFCVRICFPVKEFVITENGASFDDVLENNTINDVQRITYFRDYLTQVLRAKKEGIPVTGYFVWTLMDNFEWAEGYRQRFGIVYTDFATQKRYLKNSAIWWKQFLSSP